ncbi:MAG: S41 family peptidase [Pseudomonadota bacterium]|nr:S41 family peptidase [Pseudomonadota bacterium]
MHLRIFSHNPTNPSNTLSEALRQVSESYVTEISEAELLQFAIDGMMNGLDEHSGYLDPNSYQSLQATTTGRFGGIGIELGVVEGHFTVIAPMDGTPAAYAGLEPGDRINTVNDKTVRGMKMKRLIKLLRGEPGSVVKLSISREGEKDFVVDLERTIIRVASVKSHMMEPGYGYLRISQFQTSTGKDVRKAINMLNADESGPLEGLVLDLRNNPGGTLQSSVEVADHFLNEGLIVYTEGRLRSSHAKYRATFGDLLDGVPLVVLINRGSASASEIVAAALKDHGRAQLFGAKSYGKGSVQSVLPLDDEQALKLTTAYYYTPSGASIHQMGIEPDVVLSVDDEVLLSEAIQHLKMQAATQHVYLTSPEE